MNKFKGQLRCYKFFGKYAWENSKSYYAWQILSFLIKTMGPFVNIIGIKYLLDEIVIKDNRNVYKVLFLVMFICFGNFIYDNINKMADENLGRINENLTRKLHTKLSMCCVDIKFEYTENKSVLDIINNAQRVLIETNSVNGIMNPLIDIVSNIFIILGVIVLVCTKVPILLIPVVICFVVNYIVSRIINRIRQGVFNEIGKIERKVAYYCDELKEPRYAKDIRLYNTKDIFLEELLKHGEDYYNLDKRFSLKIMRIYNVFNIVQNLSTLFIYLILGINALKKKITIGEFSSFYQATSTFNDSLQRIISSYTTIAYSTSILKYYVDFVENTANKSDMFIMNKQKENSRSENKNISIEFINVSFKYPNTDKYILKNISTKILSGEHLSIVGKNGAGKTTFIKLLCRLYDNYEGEILVDGKDIKEYSFKEYMKLLSVVFQDFRLFAFTIKENVTVFENKMEDLNEIYDIAGILEWINNLDEKDNTYIYKYFVESGVEPSGGQGQKIAIARALYRNAPIVVLDEPTAALDPISEYEIYNNFDKLVENRTAVYISHRLSSCKFCNRVIVFDDGEIIEEGTHETLMEKENGFYALMYKTQAKQYNIS